VVKKLTMPPPGHPKASFTTDEARAAGTKIGLDWGNVPWTVETFRTGMNEELEHGTRNPLTNVTNDDPVVTGKIALAHLIETPDYYQKLDEADL
jgi:hypothetical protein